MNKAYPPSIYSDAIFSTAFIGSQMQIVLPPVRPQDAANKEYVDTVVGSLPSAPLHALQFNNGSTFGGTSELLWDSSNNILEASGAVINATNIANDIAVNKLISGSIIELDNISPLTGQALVFNGTKASWQNITAGGAGGSDTQLQFNQTGILQGSNRLIWDYNQNKFTVIGKCYATEFYTTSDERLKRSIKIITEDEISCLNKINGYSYLLESDPEVKYGLLAGEVEKSGLVNLISYSDDTKKINYQSFIPLLLEKIKSLEIRINILEKSI